jgi:hypothetical protein
VHFFKSNIVPYIETIGATHLFEHLNVLDEVELNPENYKAKWVKFHKTTFNELVFVKDAMLGVGIGFEECIFMKGIIFENAVTNGFDTVFSFDSDSIYFKDCIFHKFVQFRGKATDVDREIKFQDCKIHAGIEFNDTKTTTQGISINGCQIAYKFEFNDVKTKQSVLIRDCSIDTNVRFFAGEFNTIGIVNSIFKKNLIFWGCNIRKHLAFNDGEFQDGVRLKAILGDGTLNIIGGQFKESFLVDYEDKSNTLIQGFKNLYFNSCEFNNGLYVNGVQNIVAERPILDSIILRVSSKMQGDISFSSLHVGEIDMSGINSKATIKFDDIHVNRLMLKYFYNHSQLVLLGLRASYLEWFRDVELEGGKVIKDQKESLIQFSHSNLGKAQLYSFNFESFKKVHIYNTILSEIVVSNVKWFNPKVLGLIDVKAAIIGARKQKKKITKQDTVTVDLLARREIFRQLKYACDKQGDRVQALEFQRWEMDYYRQYLNVIEDKNLDDRFILWSSLSNNFGQSWVKALVLGLIFTFLFYIPIALLGSGKLEPYKFATSWSDLWISVKEVCWFQLPIYVQLLNPTHVMARMYKDAYSLPGAIHVFDFFIRVLSAYFIFQIISAFRKYVK